MRIRRTNYDKSHRCPGYSGGGFSSPPEPCLCPEGGYVTIPNVRDEDGYPPTPAAAPWRFGRCSKCDIVTLPHVTRWLFPSYVLHAFRWRVWYSVRGLFDR